jgi:Flp pilus assembly protein TadG
VFVRNQFGAFLDRHAALFRGDEAAALIEFAVALPLLVVLIVGIFDFGGAFNLKQEITNAAREGARFGASQPTQDLSNSPAVSVNLIRSVVSSYLQTAGVNGCDLSSASQVLTAPLTWSYTPSGGGCTLTIRRGVPVQQTIGGSTVNMLCTNVNITYAYRWHFNSVIQLLVPGANYTFTPIHSDSTVVNAN